MNQKKNDNMKIIHIPITNFFNCTKTSLFDQEDAIYIADQITEKDFDRIVFSFEGIEKVNQLFISILINNLYARYGKTILKKIEFSDCSSHFFKMRMENAIENIQFNILKNEFLSKTENEKIEELINSININKANFEHICENGKINGELYIELKRVMNELISFERTRNFYANSNL